MKFLDKKEQVLDLQLTPHGEYLLSQGLFRPQYYSFHDENVLYDPQYAGHTDRQNDIEPRIQEETPQLGTQVVFSDRNIFLRRGLNGVAGSIDSVTGLVINEGSILQTVGEGTSGVTIDGSYHERRMYQPHSYLGTSDTLTTGAPAWSVSMLRGEVTSSARAISGSQTPTIKIPQLNVTLAYTISVKRERSFISDTELAIEYPNGEFLDVKPEILLAQVVERNAEFTSENFEIEVFEVVEEKSPGLSTYVEKLRPLKFRKPISLVQDGILLDEDEVIVPVEPLSKDYVEYYLNIKVDRQIDEQLICSSVEELKSRGLHVETEIECEDTKNISLVDIYTTDASSRDCPDPKEDDTCKDTVY